MPLAPLPPCGNYLGKGGPGVSKVPLGGCPKCGAPLGGCGCPTSGIPFICYTVIGGVEYLVQPPATLYLRMHDLFGAIPSNCPCLMGEIAQMLNVPYALNYSTYTDPDPVWGGVTYENWTGYSDAVPGCGDTSISPQWRYVFNVFRAARNADTIFRPCGLRFTLGIQVLNPRGFGAGGWTTVALDVVGSNVTLTSVKPYVGETSSFLDFTGAGNEWANNAQACDSGNPQALITITEN